MDLVSPVTLSQFLAALGPLEREHDGWLAKCPSHGDSHNSLRITTSAQGRVLVKCRAGCETRKVMGKLGYTMADLTRMIVDDENVQVISTSSTDALPEAADLDRLREQLAGYTAALFEEGGQAALDYAYTRFGIDRDDAERLGLGFARHLEGGPRLVVPFRDMDGEPLGFQARSLDPKAKVRWYGPRNPAGASWAKIGYFPGTSGWNQVIVTEGPGDALTACAVGYDTVAIRGASLVSNQHTIDQLEKVLAGRVAIIAGDGDFAGREFSFKLAQALHDRKISARIVEMDDGEDITDLRANDPGWFKKGFIQRVENSRSVNAMGAVWDTSRYTLDDVGAAHWLRDKIVAEGSDIRFTPATGFYLYDNGVWEPQHDTQIANHAQIVGHRLLELTRLAYEKARKTGNEDDYKAAKRAATFTRHARSSRGIDALVEVLKSVPGVFAQPEDFDRHLHLLATRNGVVDLRTGELLEHDSEFLITKRVDFDYDPDARCPRWLQFLNEVFPETADQVGIPAFLQRLVGYGITGEVKEQVFVVNYGTGANGKSLFTETLADIFRDITVTTPFSTFEAKRVGGSATELATLKGARMVMAPEGEQNKPMAEAVLKRMTGRDLIAARHLYRDYFEFRPQFLLFLTSNYRPAFRGQDDGLWRRILMLEWRQQFKGSARDRDLPEKLIREAQGILAWAVEGARIWYETGLDTPEATAKMTADYRTQSDVLTGFFGGEWVSGSDHDWVPRKDLYESFRDYAEVENMQDLNRWSSRTFYRAVEERGYPLVKRRGIFGFRGLVKGPGLHAAPEDPAELPLAAPSTMNFKGPSLDGWDA